MVCCFFSRIKILLDTAKMRKCFVARLSHQEMFGEGDEGVLDYL